MGLKGYMGGAFLGLWFVVAGLDGARAEEDFVMVVNVGVDLEQISRQDVELIFLGKKRRWHNGENIGVVINENPPIHQAFSHRVLRRSPRQYLMFRKKMLFRGQGMPPPAVQSDLEVIRHVTSHPHGLGFVGPASVTPQVKVVQIIH